MFQSLREIIDAFLGNIYFSSSDIGCYLLYKLCMMCRSIVYTENKGKIRHFRFLEKLRIFFPSFSFYDILWYKENVLIFFFLKHNSQ